MPQYKLGCLEQFDDRSKNFPIRTMLSNAPLRNNTWPCKIYLDQGKDGACVGFAFAHEFAALPSKVEGVTYDVAMKLYRKARDLDEFEGNNYEGTSILGGVKACQELYPRCFDSYRWAFGIDDVLHTLSKYGPIVVGLTWWSEMFLPNKEFIIKAKGFKSGRHGFLLNGINVKKELVRIHNSWGPSWANRGEAFISWDDLRKLLKDNGEACVPFNRHKFYIPEAV